MADMSRPVPGPQPGPDQTASSHSGDPLPSRMPIGRADRDRRRHPLPATARETREPDRNADERTLIELRRKVQAGELLSTSTERLLWNMKFNGHLTVVVQNGRLLKSGYEEGYFRRRSDLGGFLLDM
jgi:hypothetical protein